MLENKPYILVITGPTASGKTAVAVDVSLDIGGEIISADSMQIYKHMSIGTAKPTEDELKGVTCHLIDYVEPDYPYNVFKYKTDADAIIKDVIKKGNYPILCGGTGLYIDTVLKNTSLSTNSNDDEVRKRLIDEAKINGNNYLYNKLLEVDNVSAQRIHPNDLKRIVRSLEIFITTGKKQSDWDAESNKLDSNYSPFRILLAYRDRNVLYNRINIRVDKMVKDGLVDEAKCIYDNYDRNKISAIGYPELFKFFDGDCSLHEAIEHIKQYSRNYAKRQLTWFRKGTFEKIYFMDELSQDFVVSDILNNFTDFVGD